MAHTSSRATTLGCGAILIWSFYALLASSLINLPSFEVLVVIFSVGFLSLLGPMIIQRRWPAVKQPLWLWVLGVLGICGTDMAYISAVHYAPPAHVDFIDFLWPFFVILCVGFLPREKLTVKPIIAGILGVVGLYVLLTDGQGLEGFEWSYWPGYLLALCAALIWGAYSLLSRHYGNVSKEMIGMYCGIGAVISLFAHCQFEEFVMPTLAEVLASLLWGVMARGAYLLWNTGLKDGNLKLLSILTYFTPIVSMTALVWFGVQPLTPALIYSCLLVATGVVINSINTRRLTQKVLAAFISLQAVWTRTFSRGLLAD